MTKTETQWYVIKLAAKIFEENNIEYHYDASTAAFVHGCDFEMSDIDVVFLWSSLQKVKDVLQYDFGLTEVEYMESKDLDFFFAHRDGEKIHCLFYRSTNNDTESFYDEVVELEVDGQRICSKSINYYLKKKKMKHYLKRLKEIKSNQ